LFDSCKSSQTGFKRPLPELHHRPVVRHDLKGMCEALYGLQSASRRLLTTPYSMDSEFVNPVDMLRFAITDDEKKAK
jgi:hypothetical protein